MHHSRKAKVASSPYSNTCKHESEQCVFVILSPAKESECTSLVLSSNLVSSAACRAAMSLSNWAISSVACFFRFLSPLGTAFLIAWILPDQEQTKKTSTMTSKMWVPYNKISLHEYQQWAPFLQAQYTYSVVLLLCSIASLQGLDLLRNTIAGTIKSRA